jgi:hypothetical protein
LESINMGTPLMLTGARRKATKDIAALAAFCGNLKSSRVASAA